MAKLQMRNSVEHQVALGAVASVLMLISIGWLSHYTTNRLVVTQKWVAHTHEVIATLESGLAILTDAETKQRGYLLTGSDQFLRDCQAAQAQVAGWYKQIRQITSDNPQAQHQLDVLEPLISQKLAVLNERIKVRQEQGIQATAEDLKSLQQGKALMDQVWQNIAMMQAAEVRLLSERQNAAQASANVCQAIIVSGCGLACVVGIAAFLMARHGLQAQARVQRELKKSQALMESILDNTPSSVFIKDLAGRYLLVNRQFAEVAGRTREEIQGKTVFEISRKDLAQKADEHFQTVMKTEKAVVFEEIVQHPDGPHPHLAVKFPVRDTAGKIWAMAGISTDITERKRVEQEVKAANEQLRAANQELEAFSYSVSHDLRAPLRHIDGFVGLLRKQSMEKLNEKETRYLDVIANAARQMGALIDDLLIFSRMSRTELRRAPVALGSLVEESIKGMQNEFEGRQINWKISALPAVEGDMAMLRQVWVNLISNAVKYTRTRKPAEIEVGCQDELNGEWIFFVRDNGVGFDMQYAHKLFGVFQRLHRPDEFEGTGIGLANVRRIVFRHGGRTWAEGKPDGGAIFYFSLPKQNNNQQKDYGTIKTDITG